MSSSQLPLLNFLSSTPDSQWSQANESLILEPFTYIASNPGKGVRTLLLEALNIWLAVPSDQLKIIHHIVQMLHNASLMIDDIEDDAHLRRGRPATHKIYGIPQTINTANYIYFLAYKELAKLRRQCEDGEEARLVDLRDLDSIVTEELLNLHRGQGLEILWRDLLQCPTMEEYTSMVNNKTGGGFRMPVKLMMALATKNLDIDFVPLTNIIGVYFQIRDDYMNLQSAEQNLLSGRNALWATHGSRIVHNLNQTKELKGVIQYSDNKGFAEDLTEGKFSFPIVHGVRADDGNNIVTSVLQKRPTTPTLKHHVIDYLRTKTKSFDYTLTVIRSLEQQAREEVARLGGNPQLEMILDILHV